MYRILCDENIPQDLILMLRSNFDHVGSVRESHSGISDYQVMKLLNTGYDCLITMDKDFGSLIFEQDYNLDNTSIILLRDPMYENYLESIIQALTSITSNQFVIITQSKVRIISL